jgi:ribose transport system substrate-binding protein
MKVRGKAGRIIKCLSLVVVSVFGVALLAGAAVAAQKTYRIGVTFYDLSNPIWAATGEEIVRYSKSQYGMETTLLGAENNAATQVSQMENLIESGADLIIVGAVDENSLTDVIARARRAGVKVMAYGTEPIGCDVYYTVDNYNVGLECGRRAGTWIKEKLGGKAEVAVLDFPTQQVLIARADGIKAGIKETAPNAQIVATQAAADSVTGLNVTENILQEHPNVKVIACIGDGGGIGANNAVKSAGRASADFGIFSVDATEEAVRSIKAGDPLRMSVGLGTENQKAHLVTDIANNVLTGKPFDNYYYTPVDPVDITNADAYIKAAGW